MAEGKMTGAPIELPIIDISNPNDPVIGKAMIEAAARYGFLYVNSRGSDITVDDVDRAFELSREFFASPEEEKAVCRITPNNRGWSGMHTETLDPEHQRTGDFKEAMNFGEFKDGKAQQPLPPSLARHEAEIGHFASLCHMTCTRILKLLALGLEVQTDFFTSRHDPSKGPTGSILRFLYYPSITSPETASYKHEVDVRAGAHSDYGSITLLFQRPGQPGLEILTHEEEGERAGVWAPVPVVPNTTKDDSNTNHIFPFPPILVNIGDLLNYWTDGLLKSTVHRVVFPVEERDRHHHHHQDQVQEQGRNDRYSIAYFCHPVDTTELVPIPSDIVKQYREEKKEEQQQRVIPGTQAAALTAQEHLESRLAATYGFTRNQPVHSNQ